VALRECLQKSLRGIFVPLGRNATLRSSSACRSHDPLGRGRSLFGIDRNGLGQIEQTVVVLSLLAIADSAGELDFRAY